VPVSTQDAPDDEASSVTVAVCVRVHTQNKFEHATPQRDQVPEPICLRNRGISVQGVKTTLENRTYLGDPVGDRIRRETDPRISRYTDVIMAKTTKRLSAVMPSEVVVIGGRQFDE